MEQESYDDGIDHSSVSINQGNWILIILISSHVFQEELQARNQSIKRRFPRSYFTNSGKGLSALIKAVVRFFPWEVQHSKKAAAWAQVAEDFNSTLPPSHPRLSGARAKEVIESQISIYTSYLEDSEKSSEFISGHSFTDPEVVASMGKLLERKSAFDKKAVSSVSIRFKSYSYLGTRSGCSWAGIITEIYWSANTVEKFNATISARNCIFRHHPRL